MTDQEFLQCVRCGHWNELPKAEKSKLRRFGAFMLAAIPVAGFALGLATFLAPVETVDIGKARAFLGAYYANAPFQPKATWKDLTDSYKANNPDLNYAEYERYFTQFSEASATDVGNYEPGRGQWYAATFYRKNKNGSGATDRFAFHLECPWYSRLPGFTCSSSNIQIANACKINPKSGRCKQDETATETLESQ